MKTLGRYYKAEAVYQIEQYTYVEKWKWLKYAPSFGWDFAFGRPIVGWNANSLFDAINFSRKKQAYLSSIVHKTNLNYQRASISLKLKYDIFGTNATIYTHKLRILELEKSYMEILLSQYKKHEISPSQYIQSQISYENKILELNTLLYDLQTLRNEILQLAFFGETEELLKSVEDVQTN